MAIAFELSSATSASRFKWSAWRAKVSYWRRTALAVGSTTAKARTPPKTRMPPRTTQMVNNTRRLRFNMSAPLSCTNAWADDSASAMASCACCSRLADNAPLATCPTCGRGSRLPHMPSRSPCQACKAANTSGATNGSRSTCCCINPSRRAASLRERSNTVASSSVIVRDVPGCCCSCDVNTPRRWVKTRCSPIDWRISISSWRISCQCWDNQARMPPSATRSNNTPNMANRTRTCALRPSTPDAANKSPRNLAFGGFTTAMFTASGTMRVLGRQRQAHGVNHALVVWLAKDGAASHKGVRSGIGHTADVVGLDAAVHLQADVFARSINALAHVFDLAQRRVNEALAAKARVHAHDQNQVDVFDHPVQHIQLFGRVEHQAGLHALALDGLDAAVHMARSVWVEADVIGSRLGKAGGQGVHGRDHQVHVNRHRHAGRRLGMRLEGTANHGAEGQVGHVMVVHHVEMDPVRARVNDVFDLFPEAGEVGGQDGGGDAVRHGRGLGRVLTGPLFSQVALAHGQIRISGGSCTPVPPRPICTCR